jgi:hypothetical protein
MLACVAAFVVDTIYQLIYTSAQTRVWTCPELALLPVSILLEYFYTEIRFSAPTLSAPLGLAGQIYVS